MSNGDTYHITDNESDQSKYKQKQRTIEKKSNRTHMMKRGEIIMSTMTITQFKITIKTKCTRISNNHMDI